MCICMYSYFELIIIIIAFLFICCIKALDALIGESDEDNNIHGCGGLEFS